ncbi:MAG: calcium/sodium antiporter [Alphaproteobacteria bacterium]|nr:calcium/sodium antiporter [Alphaproteobacteria bacterium]
MTFLQIAAGFILLLLGAEFLVRGAVALARRLEVSPMVIGMTVVAYGTTAPELVVSLEAALTDVPAIAVGNVIGSNIANILLILGAAAVIYPIACKPQALKRDGAVMLGAAVLMVVLGLTGAITAVQGAVMLFALITLTLYAYWSERRNSASADLLSREAEEFAEWPRSLWPSLLAVIGGIASVVFGAQILVAAAVELARDFGISEAVIGLTLVAVGTSLPELATAAVAAYRRHPDIAIGNVVGANTYNILAILGVVSMVEPLTIPAQIVGFDIWFMLAATILLLAMILVRGGLSRAVGAGFLAVYGFYLVAEYTGIAAGVTIAG